MMLRHPPGHLQRTAAYFLAQGHYDLLMRDMRREFAKRRMAAVEALDGTALEMVGAARFGGTSLWIKAPDGVDTVALGQALLRDGVVIEPGAPFFSGPDQPTEFFRLGYSSIPADRIAEGIRRIDAKVAEFC